MKTTSAEDYQKSFFDRLGSFRIDKLLDRSTGVYFFVKDREGRVVAANQLTLERYGLTEEHQIIGKTDYDFFSQDLADKYVRDDKRVMDTGVPIEGMAELAPNDDGELDCYFTNKMPLFDTKGEVIGVAGTTVSYDLSLEYLKPYTQIAPAVRLIMQEYSNKLSIPAIAKQFNLPSRQFSEQFKDTMTYTPQTFIVLVRLHYACLALINSDDPIADIAKKVGFYDHSNFTRQFKLHLDDSPSAYRKKYSRVGND